MKCIFAASSQIALISKLKYLQRRYLTPHQASVALRPFYFAVHPDRFAQEPDVRSNNEKALQVFNEYLNNLFPKPGLFQPPVQVNFAIRGKDNNLRNIRIVLSGIDVERIIRLALEKCELSTENLPKSDQSIEPSSSASTSQNKTPWSTHGLDAIWQNLQENERLRRRGTRSVDLFTGILINRERALQRMENHRCIMELIKDEIDYIIRNTGVTQIVWAINWDQSHMRRCLLNVQSMIGDVDQDVKENIIHALNGRKLLFGRGSYICCDGSLQFGADDATGAWQKVCIESTVRRFDVRNMELLLERIREMLGGVHLVLRPNANVLNCIQQLQIFIGRICSQPKAEREGLKHLLSPEISVEIVNCYNELMVIEGRLQIPCCVDFATFKKFIIENGTRSQQIRHDYFARKWQLELARDGCVRTLSLAGLTWDNNLSFESLMECIDKMRQVHPDKIVDFAQLSLHLSSSPKLFVMFNGRISVPIDWVKEL